MNKFSLKNINLIDVQSFKDKEGTMTIIQSNLDISFRIMRVFSISAISCTRGNHAHKNCHQFIVCLSGSLLIYVDDGTSKKTFLLDSSSKGLHIPPGFWSYQEYGSSQTIVNVYCDLEYDEQDYIRNYEDYKIFISKS
jgi:UDP-2-acetamido-3-amino-2,3-dideoxy-glucuronate N-acetyltransferase